MWRVVACHVSYRSRVQKPVEASLSSLLRCRRRIDWWEVRPESWGKTLTATTRLRTEDKDVKLLRKA